MRTGSRWLRRPVAKEEIEAVPKEHRAPHEGVYALLRKIPVAEEQMRWPTMLTNRGGSRVMVPIGYKRRPLRPALRSRSEVAAEARYGPPGESSLANGYDADEHRLAVRHLRDVVRDATSCDSSPASTPL